VISGADGMNGAPAGRSGVRYRRAVAGLYCLDNFRHCRETHCTVTGPGWPAAGTGRRTLPEDGARAEDR
jgi:hypothetical protein